MNPNKFIFTTVADAHDWVSMFRRVSGQLRWERRLVWTNGCFDLLHVGHIHTLQAAKAAGHLLLVGLNSDESISKLKGDKRPIISVEHRASMLLALEYVDAVLILDDDIPFHAIRQLKPDVIVRGGGPSTPDKWLAEMTEVANEVGADFMVAPAVVNSSTTEIIQKIIDSALDEYAEESDED